jgi:hypothetical protein
MLILTHETNLTLIDNDDDYDVEWERKNINVQF